MPIGICDNGYTVSLGAVCWLVIGSVDSYQMHELWNYYLSFLFYFFFYSILNINFYNVLLCWEKMSILINCSTQDWLKIQKKSTTVIEFNFKMDITIWIWLMDFVLNSQLWHKYMCYFHLFEVVRRRSTHAHTKDAHTRLCMYYIICVFITFCTSHFCQCFSQFILMIRFFFSFPFQVNRQRWLKWSYMVIFSYSLGDLLVMPFLVEFRIEPSRLKLDCRTILMEFFGGNGCGDGSFICSMGLCLPQRPIIIFNSFK